jgi:hypothetical protein
MYPRIGASDTVCPQDYNGIPSTPHFDSSISTVNGAWYVSTTPWSICPLPGAHAFRDLDN